MGNAYPATRFQKQFSEPVRDHDDADLDSDPGSALASLLEENARLRALVVQLSDIVLRNVVSQK